MRIRTAPAARSVARWRSRLTRFAVVSGVTAAVAAGSVVAASPASAHPTCDPGFHCQFFTFLGSSRHQEFNSDGNLSDDFFDNGAVVNNNSWAASNSSTGGFESHYYDGFNNTGAFLFCINPGNGANVPVSLRDRASSLRLRPRTSVVCLA
jgi:hypothetical protein